MPILSNFFCYSQKMAHQRRNQVWTNSNKKKTILGSKMLAQRSLWNLRGNVIPVQTAGLTFLNHSICLIMENLFQWWQDESGMRLLVKARRMRRSSHLSSVCQWLEARIIYIYIYILYIYIYIHIITLQCCYTHTRYLVYCNVWTNIYIYIIHSSDWLSLIVIWLPKAWNLADFEQSSLRYSPRTERYIQQLPATKTGEDTAGKARHLSLTKLN